MAGAALLNVQLGTLTAKVSCWPLISSQVTLVFIHGAGFHSGFWRPQRALSHKFNLVMVNLPGRQGSDVCSTAIEAYAERVEQSIALLETPVLMVGHSMGGAVVQRLLLSRPYWLVAAVLACTGARLKVAPVVNHLLSQGGNAFTQMFAQGSQKLTLEHINALGRELAKPDIGVCDFVACNQFDVMAQISQIQLPCLIVVGTLDVLTPEKYSQYLHDQIKDSELVLVKDTGHLLPWEASEHFNQMIAEFAHRHEPNLVSSSD